jgi:hypothetical protein
LRHFDTSGRHINNTVRKMGSVKAARASDPASNPAETQNTSAVPAPQISNVPARPETANGPGRPERPASPSLHRPKNLEHRKLRPVLPPAFVRRASTPLKKGTDLRRERLQSISKPKSNLYLLPEKPEKTPSALPSAVVVVRDEPATPVVAPLEFECESATPPVVAVAPLCEEVPAPSANPSNRRNSLQMKGSYWEICYEERSAIIDDSRGLRYVALLILNTGENRGPLHATELVALAKGAGNVLIELPSKDPVIDATAENQITKRLEQIAFERNDACARGDYDRVAILDSEVDEITVEYERLKGRGRKKATFNNDGEKARKAVSKAIADLIAKLGSMPEMEPLANHLTEAIRKGQWLSYKGNMEWKIDFSGS